MFTIIVYTVLRLTGVVARIVMDYWAKKIKEMAADNNITLYMLKKYVDDVNLILEALNIGHRWNGTAMEWRKEWEEEDKKNGEMDDKRTMREIRKMSNSVLPFVNFKEEVASDCQDGKVPMLDFQVWRQEYPDKDREGGKRTEIHYEFFEKPVATKLVLMEKNALPHRMKITTLTQEIIRRMKNTSRTIGKKRRAVILTNFMKKIMKYGYGAKTRRNVAIAGLKGYYRMVKTEEEGGRRVNRPRWERTRERRFKKLGGKANWFKKVENSSNKYCNKGGKGSREISQGIEGKIETVMFVPHTPGGQLARLLQEADDRFIKGKRMGRV